MRRSTIPLEVFIGEFVIYGSKFKLGANKKSFKRP